MTRTTPKPGSEELGRVITRVEAIVERPDLTVLVAAALERPKLERIVARAKTAAGVPFSQLSREALAERAVAGFGSANADVSFDILRELDRVSENERTLLASTPEDAIAERFVTDSALASAKHGAQLVWAMVRDDRLAPASVRDVMVRYRSVATDVSAERRPATPEERERAHLLAEISRRENALQLESARARELESRVSALQQLEARVAALQLELAQRPTESAEAARREDKKLAHLERQAAAADSLKARIAELESENELLKRTVAALRGTLADKNAEKPAEKVAERPLVASAEAVNRTIAGATSSAIFAALGTPLVAPPKRVVPPRERQRVGVLVDVANVAGAARLLFEKSVDYFRLLDVCRDGRVLVEAHAYVIDKGLPGVDAFTAALRHGAYKVHVKKPKTFPDGTVKADWDLAIAVDAIGLAERCDVIVLASGDGDFVPLIQGLRRRRVFTEAIAFPERAAHDLVSAVDQFHALGPDILQT